MNKRSYPNLKVWSAWLFGGLVLNIAVNMVFPGTGGIVASFLIAMVSTAHGRFVTLLVTPVGCFVGASLGAKIALRPFEIGMNWSIFSGLLALVFFGLGFLFYIFVIEPSMPERYNVRAEKRAR